MLGVAGVFSAGAASARSEAGASSVAATIAPYSIAAPKAAEAIASSRKPLSTGQSALGEVPPPQVSITIGAEGLASGAARYAIRTVEAGQPLVVSFSSQPPMLSSDGARILPNRWPVDTARLTSGFGVRWHPILGGSRFHAGLDLAAPYGSPIKATMDGVVARAGVAGGYGLLVELRHGGGVETRYAHMSRLNVHPGQSIHTGDVIGFVGSTGESTGPHVHYEVRINGVAVNPF